MSSENEIELQNGIMNLVIALCEDLKLHMPAEVAKEKVAKILISFADGLTNTNKENNIND